MAEAPSSSSPVKSVRFVLEEEYIEGAGKNEGKPSSAWKYRSPPPPIPTPSPTLSGSTDSSEGPITPLSPIFGLPVTPKDVSHGTPMKTFLPKLNPALSTVARLMRWDVDSDPNDLIDTYDLDGSINEAASLPPNDVHIARMRIIHSSISEWPLTVEKSPKEDILTVKQVITSLHKHCCKAVKGEHVESLPAVTRNRVYDAYRRRPSKDSILGIRRIDYLPQRTFLGLQVHEYNEVDGIWVFELISK